MTSIHPRHDMPSTSRSLPPIPVDALDRGRAKTRINTDPDAYANLRTPSGTVSISLPPIRPSGRGSKDEGCGPLPGISSIIDQSELTRPARRLSESSPRVFPSDWHSQSLWAPRQTRVDSISTTDGSPSRASSPDLSALSSSTSSLSSILEDRSSCTSPGPIQLPRFLGNRLPPVSAFELSDLRTSLPSDESARRSGPSRTPVFRSPRSTPLPLSRPMSPAIQLSPHLRPLTHRLRSLAVTVDSPPRQDEKPTTPPASVKSEPETDSAPSSPRSKGLSEPDLPQEDEVDMQSNAAEQRDEHMACTPTQPDPKEPLPWMDTEPSTPTNRHSPLADLTSSPSAEDEDSKSAIVKQSESETEDEEEMSYAERRAQRQAANAGPIDTTTVRTRGGNFDWLMSPAYPSPELTQIAQRAEHFGYKLHADPRLQATTQSQLLMQMAERQHRIERLQREQAEAAETYRMATTWGASIDPPFGGMQIPEFAPPSLPSFTPVAHPPPIPPMSSIPQQAIPQQPIYVPDMLDPHDYAFASTSGYTDLPHAGLDPYPSLSPPGLTAASSATSASSPSDSFYLSSPPPSALPTHIMPGPSTRPTFKAQDTIPENDLLAGTLQSGSGTHKCQSCGKTFRRPSGLKDHMNIHSGEKPYCCPLETCRKGFATRSNMIRHHNKTHPNRPKIGGVADIGNEDEPTVDIADPTSPDQGSSSQSRFRVVQQSSTGKEVGVGPMRGAKERRTMRKQTVSGPSG